MVDNRDAGFVIQGNVLEKYTGTAEHVVIPDSVAMIDEDAFKGCLLVSIDIPDSVIRIRSAFQDCVNLTTVSIPDSVEVVGTWAFMGCANLESVHIGAAVNKIGDAAFSGCSRLRQITVSEKNASFSANGGALFDRGFKKLVRYPAGLSGPYSLPETVQKVGAHAFGGCSELTAVTISGSVTKLLRDCFAGCAGLSTLSLPGSLVGIGPRAFRGCSGLLEVHIPDGVTEIPDEAFLDCSSLSKVRLPQTLTKIGMEAFWGCTSLIGPDGLSTLDIPDSVVSVGWRALPRAEFQVDGIKYEVLDASSVSVSCVVESSDEEDENREVLIPAAVEHSGRVYSVVEIGGDAFTNCREWLTAVEMPDSVKRIDDGAFSVCTNLTRVTLPDSVTTIGDCAFSDCSGLALLKLGSGVTSIGSEAFYGCRALASVVIPESLNSIGDYAFPSKTKLIRPKKAKAEPAQRASDIPIPRDGDAGGQLFGETIVFTGALQMPRRKAADLATRAGCKVLDNVTKATTLLVVGDQDLEKLHGHEKSSKHRKAEELAAAGQPIRIIGETEFLGLVSPGEAK